MLSDNTWGNNISSTPVTIAKASRDGEFSFFSRTHVGQTLIPSFNDLSCSQLELERLVAIKAVNDKKQNETTDTLGYVMASLPGVELCAITEGTGIVHRQNVTIFRFGLAFFRYGDNFYVQFICQDRRCDQKCGK
jgi:hypothetical protein